MKYVLLLIGLLLMLPGEAQRLRYVVPGGAGSQGGTSWTEAMSSVETALAVPGVTEVRVRWGTYLLPAELVVPVGVTLSGGWDTDGERKAGGTEATVLQPAGQFRVATVKGTIDGFTVTGGIAKGKDGGGLYVVTGGKIINCIVKNNISTCYYPKIGDCYCIDGTFLQRGEITESNKSKIKGIVFWVNSDPAAIEGTRGWVVAIEGKPFNEWAKNGTNAGKDCVTGTGVGTVEEALADTAGRHHTYHIKNAVSGFFPDDCYAAKHCWEYRSNKGESWYLPAIGQLRVLFNEWKAVTETYWEIYPDDKLKGWLWPAENIEYYSSSENKDDFAKIWTLIMKNEGGGLKSSVNKNDTFSEMILALPVTSF